MNFEKIVFSCFLIFCVISLGSARPEPKKLRDIVNDAGKKVETFINNAGQNVKKVSETVGEVMTVINQVQSMRNQNSGGINYPARRI